MTGSWRTPHTLAALVVVPAVSVVVGLLLPSAIWAWLVITLLFAALLVVIGHGLTGYWHGLLIDERNAVSLSRLQAVVWTVLVVSSFVTACLVNVRVDRLDPVDISVPGELWALIGIAATSLVATPLLHQIKEQKRPRKESFAATLRALGYEVSVAQLGDTADGSGLRVFTSSPPDRPAPPESRGVVVVKASPADSTWSDIFRGEDTGNAARPDVGKIQMLYFTMAVVVAYAVALGSVFVGADSGGVDRFPSLSEGIVALLAISHGAYLVNMAVDRP